MKTTIEIPDALFDEVASRAAERGQNLAQFVAEALQEKLASRPGAGRPLSPTWMSGFGKLPRLRKETARIQAAIDGQFEIVEREDRL